MKHSRRLIGERFLLSGAANGTVGRLISDAFDRSGRKRAIKMKYVPARVAAQYIRALKMSDKRELVLAATKRGRVNTTVRRIRTGPE
jgi:hypothetical protein